MLKVKRLIKSLFRLVLPTILVIILVSAAASLLLVHLVSRPKTFTYLVTPQKYGLLSSRGAQVSDEKWTNRDGSPARGWLLRGSENAPAIILLHKFGADRSHELNLGVKLSESTNFTVLMPDLRGHGENPVVQKSTFGPHETDDTLAAIDFLRNLKTPDGVPVVGNKIGIYGVEMGGLAALGAAAKDPAVTAIVLDSVPADSGAVIASAVERRYPFASLVTAKLARFGADLYFFDGSYTSAATCESGKAIADRHVMLLAGVDSPDLQASTTKLGRCIQSGGNLESKYDLSPSGYSIMSASMEKSEAYDQKVIDFFRLSLAN